MRYNFKSSIFVIISPSHNRGTPDIMIFVERRIFIGHKS